MLRTKLNFTKNFYNNDLNRSKLATPNTNTRCRFN